jgi:hypothetical protein
MTVENDALVFDLDPEKCDPETREKLVSATIKGARLRFK